MYYVYLLQSEKDGRLYIGYTSNLKLRLAEHQNGLVDSTRHRKPMKLVYYEAFAGKQLARERESQLKNFGSAYKGLLARLKIKGSVV